MQNRKILNKCELWLIIPVLIAAAALFFVSRYYPRNENGTAVISVNGVEAARLSLSEDTVYRPDGANVEITVKDGKAAVTYSDCPDKVCVRTGYISSGAIVCLPERVTVKIENESHANIKVDIEL